MKSLLITVTLLASALVAGAQTEFRHITFAEAKAAAKSEGKNIFIDFYTDWCGPCRRLAANVFPTKQVGDYLNSNYICLKVDAEKGEGPKLAKTYNVTAYPTLAVIDWEGKLLGSFAGLKEGDKFIAAVEMCNNSELKPERVKARYEAGERTPQLVLAYATMVADSGRDWQKSQKNAAVVLDDYFKALGETERLAPENAFVYTTFAWDYNNPRVEFLRANRERFAPQVRPEIDKNVDVVYETELIRYFTGNHLKNNPEAIEAYNNFRKEADALGYTEKFKNRYEFIDKRVECNDDEYLAFVDENLERLDDSEASNFMYGISEIFDTTTPEAKKNISNMLRRHIGNMGTNALYMTASAILSLENSH